MRIQWGRRQEGKTASSGGENGKGGEDMVNRGFLGEAEKPNDVFRCFLSDTCCETPVSLLYL